MNVPPMRDIPGHRLRLRRRDRGGSVDLRIACQCGWRFDLIIDGEMLDPPTETDNFAAYGHHARLARIEHLIEALAGLPMPPPMPAPLAAQTGAACSITADLHIADSEPLAAQVTAVGHLRVIRLDVV